MGAAGTPDTTGSPGAAWAWVASAVLGVFAEEPEGAGDPGPPGMAREVTGAVTWGVGGVGVAEAEGVNTITAATLFRSKPKAMPCASYTTPGKPSTIPVLRAAPNAATTASLGAPMPIPLAVPRMLLVVVSAITAFARV